MRRRDLLKSIPFLATPALAQGQRPLRFIPQANLSVLDPVWTTAIIAYMHSYMVYDTLYGIDDKNQLQPQMCAGHELSSDELTWTFCLRDGLLFHDGEKVLTRDCVMSIKRWAMRDSFGQQMVRSTNEIAALDDTRFQIRLKKPFRLMLYGLGARQCFMMPERVAQTSAAEQIKDTTGSGPFRFLTKEWVSGVSAAYAKFDGYVPREEKPVYYAGGKVVHFPRVEWIVQPDPATAAAALKGRGRLARTAVDRSLSHAEEIARGERQGHRPQRLHVLPGPQSPPPAFQQPENPPRIAARAGSESVH